MSQSTEYDKLRAFVKEFVNVYEFTLHEYYEKLYYQISKAGKWAEFLKGQLEISKGAPEAVDDGVVKASVLIGMSALSEVISSYSKYKNRNSLRALTCQAYLFKNKPDFVRGELVAAGVDVFLRYEAQLVKVIVDNSWERALSKVAVDAVDRAINYFKKNDTDFSAVNIGTGIILGPSKTYKHTSTAFPHFYKGHTVKISTTSEVWITSKIFDRTGLAVIDGNGSITNYYTRQGDKCTKYGFHLELENNVSQRHSKCNAPLPTYIYILKWDFRANYVRSILDEINSDDSELSESRIESKIDSFKHEVYKDVNNLKTFLNQNFVVLRKDIRLVSEIQQQQMTQMDASTQEHRENWRMLDSNIKIICTGIKKVDDNIHRVLNGMDASSRQVKIKRPVLFEIRSPVHSYIKRPDEFEKIRNAIDNNVVVVHGLGGVGKSELLLNYAIETLDKYQRNLIWLNATTTETLKASFLRLALACFEGITFKNWHEKGLKMISKDVYEYLCSEKSLLIFDNAPNLSTIEDVLPSSLLFKSNTPHILVSSPVRWSSTCVHIISNVHLKDFNPNQAHNFIRQALNDDSIDSDINLLAKELGYSPLALSHATSYIRQIRLELSGRLKKFTVNDYLEKLKKTPQVLFDYEGEDVFNDIAFKTIFRTIQVTLDLITAKHEKLRTQWVTMLKMLSYFSSNDIPEEVFQYETGIGENDKDVIHTSWILVEYSIVTVENCRLNVHGLVQKVIRHLIRTNNEETEFVDKSLCALKSYIRESKDAATKDFCKPHIINVWNFACNYYTLIDRHVVHVDNYTHYCAHLEYIIEGSSYSVIEETLKNIPVRDLQRILNCDIALEKQALHIAALRCEKEIAELLYNNGAKLQNQNMADTWTPLLIAASAGNIETVKYFVTKGANIKDSINGYTALHYSALYGHLNILEYCIKYIQVNDKNDDGDSALHSAALVGNLKIVECLIDNGADYHALNDSGLSPLFCAIYCNNTNVVVYLLKLYVQNCEIELLHAQKCPVLHYAAKYSSVEMCRFLISQEFVIDVNEKDENDNTPIVSAVYSEELQKIKVLVENGSDLTVQNIDGWTVLHHAASMGNFNIVQYLVTKQPNLISMCTFDHELAIHIAAIFGHLNVLTYLASMEENFDMVTRHGYTPMFLAAYKNHFDLVQYLGETKEVNCNLKCLQNNNVLHAAVSSGNAEIVEYLSRKCDSKMITECNFDGYSPLDIAVSQGNTDMVKCMLKYKPTFDGCKLLRMAVNRLSMLEYLINEIDNKLTDTELLFWAASNGPEEVIDYLIKSNRYSVNARTIDGLTILHLAACHNQRSVVEHLILRYNADPMDTAQDETTPLMLAVTYDNYTVADYLMAMLATNIGKGCTKMHIAAGMGCLQLIKDFHEQNYDFSAQDDEGYTPFLIAVFYGKLDIVRHIFNNDHQYTALVLAICEGHLELVKYFVEERSVPFDFKIKSEKVLEFYLKCPGVTPLLQAILRGKSDIVKYLVDKKPDILLNTTDNGETPLILAAYKGNKDLVQYLIEQNGMNYSMDILYYAISSSTLNVVKYLVEETEYNQTDDKRAVLTAIGWGYLDIVRYFLDERKMDLTPRSLHVALREGQRELVNYLLTEKKAYFLDSDRGVLNLNVADDGGKPALHHAARKGYTDVIVMLKEMGADMVIKNVHDSLLHQAVASGDEETVQYVLEEIMKCTNFSQIVNGPDADGDTPLMWAIEKEHVNIVDILLLPRCQCDLTLRNNAGATVLDWALKCGNYKIIHSILMSLYSEQCLMMHFYNLYGC